jgi:hypothetical protein
MKYDRSSGGEYSHKTWMYWEVRELLGAGSGQCYWTGVEFKVTGNMLAFK